MKRKKLFYILFISFLVFWFVLTSYKKTRPYGLFLFGFLWLIGGILALIRAFLFDCFPKDKVTGELIDLEKVNDEGGISYRPIYKYTYKGKEEIYRSNFSSYTFKKSKHIGDKEELLISIRNPKNIRINKKVYAFLEYLLGIIFIFVGIVILVFGIADFIEYKTGNNFLRNASGTWNVRKYYEIRTRYIIAMIILSILSIINKKKKRIT
jgi:hypothetical protein